MSHHSRPLPAEAKGNGIAVLELFTSQGCSSCPPADKLAARLQTEYRDNLIVLEFHVDYWDRLGWKDPFSNAVYTQRQWNYGEKFHSRTIYTPQAVVNGTFEVVGSDEKKLKSYIDQAIEDPSSNFLEAFLSPGAHNSIDVKWKYTGANDAAINFALVQKKAVTEVMAGENKGRKLTHTNVVRDFISINSNNSGKSVRFTLPDGLGRADVQVISYAQQDARIISAIALQIP